MAALDESARNLLQGMQLPSVVEGIGSRFSSAFEAMPPVQPVPKSFKHTTVRRRAL
jgi:hypothetical protein